MTDLQDARPAPLVSIVTWKTRPVNNLGIAQPALVYANVLLGLVIKIVQNHSVDLLRMVTTDQ